MCESHDRSEEMSTPSREIIGLPLLFQICHHMGMDNNMFQFLHHIPCPQFQFRREKLTFQPLTMLFSRVDITPEVFLCCGTREIPGSVLG